MKQVILFFLLMMTSMAYSQVESIISKTPSNTDKIYLHKSDNLGHRQYLTYEDLSNDIFSKMNISQNTSHHPDSLCIVLNVGSITSQTCFAKCDPSCSGGGGGVIAPTTVINPIVSNSLPAPTDNDQGCAGSWTSITLTITGAGFTTVNLTGAGPWDLYAEVCGDAVTNGTTSLTITRYVATACGSDTETLTFPITTASGVINSVGAVACSSPFNPCTDCSAHTFKHALYDFETFNGDFWLMEDKPALVISGATFDQTTTTGELYYSINGGAFVQGPAGTVTPTELKLSLLPFTHVGPQSYVVLRWISTSGLVNEVLYLRGYTADQVFFGPPFRIMVNTF
jgi:hypothetical protein